MHKVIIVFKLFVQQKHAPFYESACSFDDLHGKPNHTKCQSFEILKERFARQRSHFFNHWSKRLCSMGSKCLT
jgi:hypothetical protein